MSKRYVNVSEMFNSWLHRKQQTKNNINIYSLTEEQINQINKVFEGSIQGKVSQEKVFNKLYFYVINNIDYNEYSWLERISVDGTHITKENLQKQYGNKIGLEKWNHYIERQRFHMSEQFYINKYGEDEGKRFWKNYCNRQSYTCSYDYFKEKFNMSKEEFDKYNKSRAITKEGMINKYGKDEGMKRWKNYCNRQSYTNSEEYFIEKLGMEEGKKKYLEVNFLKKHTLDSYIKKYGENKGLEKYKKYIENIQKNNNKLYYSLSSQELFKNLYERIKDKFNDIKFATLNKEYCLICEDIRKVYFYDFVIEDIKICIEYNGDIYHANPKQYNPNDIPPYRGNKRTALEIWNYDNIKLNKLKEQGYNIIIVWESDYLNDKDSMLEKLLKEINKYDNRND